MKLTTEVLKAEVTRLVPQVNQYRGEDAEWVALVTRPSGWKRHQKAKVRTILGEWMLPCTDEGVQDLLDSHGSPGFPRGPVTQECLARALVHADAEVTCLVVTDPTDQEIRFIGFLDD